ncbi:MAG: hypothetical protein KJ558_00590 [Gammaproteobacteria bacterium]|nr:hypothetical protein [Gammaproteobacteria bacterium]MBU1653334.1 hypothetical protein [Gammaproteobacteria bacterium]MBU1962526.1 hypothetical protein [Gammaproteobacteria bacterium]
MIRKLSLAMAIAAALSPIDAFALGVGEIHLRSALNQVLDADIDLLSVDEGGLADVRVKLASQDAFSKAGLDRPHSLTDLKFQAIRMKDGKAAIKITSLNPIREPFLNFLIEINWSKGKLLREYTLLLDPPTSLKRRPPVVEPARVKAPPAQVKRPAPVAPPVMAEPEPRPKAAPTPASGEEYRVRRNDSVWKIAERQRPAGVSLEEMMIAIYRANPEAFYGGSINNLKYGAILRMPSREDLGRLSFAEARNEYLAQVSAWQSTTYSETRVEQVPPIAKLKPEPQAEAAVAPAPVPQPEKAAPDQGDRVEILAAKPEGKGPAGDETGKAQIENLKKDLLLAREATESARLEGSELKSRVNDLEGQVSGLERLIKLKNDQLAQMQALAEEKEKEKQRLVAEKAAAEKAAEEARTAPPPLAQGGEEPPATTPVPSEEIKETPITQPPVAEEIKETPPAEPAPEEAGQEKTADALAKLSGEVQRKPVTPAEETTTPAMPEAEKSPEEMAGQAAPSVEKPVETPAEPARETPGQAVEAVKEKPEPARKPEETAEPVESTGVKATPAEEPVIAQAVPIEPEKPVEEAATADEPPPVEGTEGQQPPAQPPVQEEPQQEAPEQAPVAQPVVEEGIFDQLLGSPLVLAGGGIALLLLVLLIMKGRGEKRPLRGEEAIPDIPVSELTDDDSIPVSFEDSHPAGRGRGQLRDIDEDTSSSFLTDFTPSELEQLGDETADVDPASESDVYMAYGRYQQAQELMREAVEREPDRTDLKLKYLEVLHAGNAKTGFMEVAARFAKEGLREQDPNGWNRIAKLGREFAPNDKLFAEVAAVAVTAVPAGLTAAPKERDFDDFDLSAEELDDSELSLMSLEKELLAERPQPPTKAEKASESPLADLALDLSKQAGMGPTDFSELDFDGLDFGDADLEEESLGDISAELTGIAPVPTREQPKGAAPEKEETGFDFDLDTFDFSGLGQPEATPPGSSIFDSAPPLIKVKEEDFNLDLGDLNLELESSEITPEELHVVPEPEPEAESFVLSTEGLDLDHLEDLSELRTEPVDQESFGLYGLSDLPPTEQIDEIQTKLELAHAYQEMGDNEGARSILDEVLEEGNEAQKAAARKLLNSL